MRVVGIVQARLGSTRLPGKVLMDIAGEPMLIHVLRRVKAAGSLDAVVLATTTEGRDDALLEPATHEQVPVFRGSESDVLRRYLDAAQEHDAEVVVRITSDCPLVDPQVIDRSVTELLDHSHSHDLASNAIRRTFPKGLDVEVLFIDALMRLDRLAQTREYREHIVHFAYFERPDLFLMHSVEEADDHSGLEWSVDTHGDLTRVRQLYERFALAERIRPWRELLEAGPA